MHEGGVKPLPVATQPNGMIAGGVQPQHGPVDGKKLYIVGQPEKRLAELHRLAQRRSTAGKNWVQLPPRPLVPSSRPEELPIHTNPVSRAYSRTHIHQIPSPRMNVQELVGVQPAHKITRSQQPCLARRVLSLVLRGIRPLHCLDDVIQRCMARNAVEQTVRAVRAVIGHNNDPVETDHEMIGQPFQKERSLVSLC